METVRGATRRAVMAAVAAAALAGGCFLRPVTGPMGAVLGGMPRDAGPIIGQESRELSGTLVVSIRWPEAAASGTSGYRAQLLPDSSAAVDITIRNGATVVGSRTVTRTPGQPVSTVTLKLPVGSDLAVSVKARPSGSGVAIATGTGTVTILAGQTSALSITMSPQFVPAIASLDLILWASGDTVTVTGSNFQPAHVGASKPAIVYATATGIATVPAGDITVDSDTQVRFVVPAGARNGNLTVSQDGIVSSQFAYEMKATLSVSTGGTIPASVATYKAKVERDQNRDGTYETTLFTTAAIAAGSMPMALAVPQDGIYRVTLDGYPASDPPAANGGSIVTATAVDTIDPGETTGSAAPSLSPRYLPAIGTLTPATGSVGDTITLAGSNFAPAWRVSGPAVFFAGSSGDVTATITTTGDTSLVVTVPAGAISGDVKVVVDGLTSPGTTYTVAGIPTPAGFVAIDPGTFTMGSPVGELGRISNETPHAVTLTQGFYLQTTEVTQGQWQALMGNNPSNFQSVGAEAPVEQVNWWDAAMYANALSASESLAACYTLSGCTGTAGSNLDCSSGTVLVTATDGNPYLCTGYRLPTEAEWEYAYRAGTTSAFYNGSITSPTGNDPNLNVIGWYSQNSSNTTHLAGQKQSNALGLYDMAGNVWEWTWDRYDAISNGAVEDPVGPQSGSSRVIRGGSWYYDAQYARAASRFGNPPGSRYYILGFRLARSRP